MGGRGIGVIGMCLTGGFALAMMVDAPVIAPVLASPALPAPLGAGSSATVSSRSSSPAGGTLTEHRQDEAVERVLHFLDTTLKPAASP